MKKLTVIAAAAALALAGCAGADAEQAPDRADTEDANVIGGNSPVADMTMAEVEDASIEMCKKELVDKVRVPDGDVELTEVALEDRGAEENHAMYVVEALASYKVPNGTQMDDVEYVCAAAFITGGHQQGTAIRLGQTLFD